MKPIADLILENGRITTLDPRRPEANEVVIVGDKFADLRAVLGFIGLTDIEVVRVEGVATSTIGAEKAAATAIAHSREILARAA